MCHDGDSGCGGFAVRSTKGNMSYADRVGCSGSGGASEVGFSVNSVLVQGEGMSRDLFEVLTNVPSFYFLG